MNETLKGKWSDHSFRHDPIVVKNGNKDAEVEGNPDLLIPWSPPGVLDVNTDEQGEVTGTLTFPAVPGVALKITGHISPAADEKHLACLEITGEMATQKGLSVNKLKGFFIESDHVVGTIVNLANDLGQHPQPVGTEGPFVLFPAKA